MAFAVSQRTREIGVRMALAALLSLSFAALIASITARRAASIDPVVALRAE